MLKTLPTFVFSNMFGKVVEDSTVNSTKCVVATIFNIPVYLSIYK